MNSWVRGKHMKFSFVVKAAVAVFQIVSSAPAADINVSVGGNVQQAIDAAQDGDRLLLAPGSYNQKINLRGKRIEILGVAGATQTILDGAGLGDSVVTARSGEPIGTILRGLTIRGGSGKSLGSNGDRYGGGVFVDTASHVAFVDCIIRENGGCCPGFAGGIYCTGVGSSVTFERCSILGNFATQTGAALIVSGGASATYDRCVVFGNAQSCGPAGSALSGGTLNVRNTIAIANSAGSPGNGCYAGLSQFWSNGGFLNISYSCFPEGNGGLGNISADPLFVSPGAGDFSLQPTSPCIDNGDPNSGLDADGTRVDMGAYPSFQFPSSYCVAKTNSLGCSPSIGYSGFPYLSGPSNLVVTASNIIRQQFGILIWSTTPAATPFQGGTLCIAPSIVRTPVQSSGGNIGQADCSGSFSFHFSSSYMAQQFLSPGQRVHCQYWSRDAGFPPPNNTSLSNALRFHVAP